MRRRLPKPRRAARAALRAPGRGKYDRAQSPAERLEEQRQRLLVAAAQVFAAKGYAHATVEAIVDAAGMSRRTFYAHFADVKAAMLALFDEASRIAFAFIEAKVRAAADPEEKLRAGIVAFLELLGEHKDLARIMFREVWAVGPEHQLRRQAALTRYGALLAEGVAEAYAAQVASRPPDELTIHALVAGIEAVGMRYVERGEERRATEAAELLVELVIRAFGPKL